MIYYIFDELLGHGKFIAFFCGFFVIFIIAAGLFILLMSPFMLAGLTFSTVISGAVGCGIGSAIVNATMMACNAQRTALTGERTE